MMRKEIPKQNTSVGITDEKAAYDIQKVLRTMTEYGIVFLSRTTVRRKN